MSAQLIINARDRLSWHHRLMSDLSTALLWAGWIRLWLPLLKATSFLGHGGARPQGLLRLGVAGGPLHFSLAAALVGASGTLLVWNRLPARKARAASAAQRERHLIVPEHVMASARRAQVCVVHHDGAGRIVRVETRDPIGAALLAG